MSSEWCQNTKCVWKKNQSQIRGNKGSKYYQSNKMSKYYFPCCSMRCREQWFDEHKDTLMSAVGYIDKQVLHLDDAWYVEYKWNYCYETRESNPRYVLINKLKGIQQPITREQAQTEDQIQQDHDWLTIDDTQAKELAVTLGLAS